MLILLWAAGKTNQNQFKRHSKAFGATSMIVGWWRASSVKCAKARLDAFAGILCFLMLWETGLFLIQSNKKGGVA